VNFNERPGAATTDAGTSASFRALSPCAQILRFRGWVPSQASKLDMGGPEFFREFEMRSSTTFTLATNTVVTAAV